VADLCDGAVFFCLSVRLFVCRLKRVLLLAAVSSRSAARPTGSRVSHVSSCVRLHPREIYASGGGLFAAADLSTLFLP